MTILRGVESNREKVGEVTFFFFFGKRGSKVKNFKKQPCTFEAFQQKSRSEEEKKELERLLGIVGSRGV